MITLATNEKMYVPYLAERRATERVNKRLKVGAVLRRPGYQTNLYEVVEVKPADNENGHWRERLYGSNMVTVKPIYSTATGWEPEDVTYRETVWSHDLVDAPNSWEILDESGKPGINYDDANPRCETCGQRIQKDQNYGMGYKRDGDNEVAYYVHELPVNEGLCYSIMGIKNNLNGGGHEEGEAESLRDILSEYESKLYRLIA